MKDLDPKDPNLVKAKTVLLLEQIRPILEKYLSGTIDKAKAKNELIKLLEGV